MSLPRALRNDTVREVGVVLTAGLLLALLSFWEYALAPTYGLDPSWGAALHLAARSDLVWGTDVAFTYGPLGFLSVPKLYYDTTGVASVAWHEFTTILALGTIFAFARRAMHPVLAFVLALGLARILANPEIVAAFGVAVLLAVRAQRHPRARWLMGAVAVFAAFVTLVKTNVGVTCGALVAVAAATGPGSPRERVTDLAGLAALYLAALVVLWVAIGEPLSALPDYAATTIEIVSGYSEAMGLDDPAITSDSPFAIAVALAGLAGCALLPAGRRLPAAALWATLAYLQFKAGFVRNDGPHVYLYFAVLAPAALLLFLRADRLRLGLGVAAVTTVGYFAVTGANVWSTLDPLDAPRNVRAAVDQARDLASSETRARLRGEGNDAIRTATVLPPEILAHVTGRSTHVFPSETSVVWAYGLDWRPLPVFQGYQAYTNDLDERNAEKLVADDGPETLLVHDQGGEIDGRFLGFEQPAVTLGIVCNFSPLGAALNWLALERGGRRCGSPRRLRTVRAQWDRPIVVPAPPRGTVVVARVRGVEVSGLERLRTLLYRAHERRVVLDGVAYRLPPDAAGGPLPVRSSPDVDLPGYFGLVPQSRRIEFQRGSDRRESGEITVEFSAVPVSPAP